METEEDKAVNDKLQQLEAHLVVLQGLDNNIQWKQEMVPQVVIDMANEAVTLDMDTSLQFALYLKEQGFPSAAVAILVIAGNKAQTLEQKNLVASYVQLLSRPLYVLRWIVAANNAIFGEVKPGKTYKRSRLPSCLQTGSASILVSVTEQEVIDGRGDKSHPTWRDTIFTYKNRRRNWPLRSEWLDYLIKGNVAQSDETSTDSIMEAPPLEVGKVFGGHPVEATA